MLVRIILGSSSDALIAKKVTEQFKALGVPYEVTVISAHRALDDLQRLMAQEDAQVYIGIAGKAAHLPGVMAGMTTRPVIGVPVAGSALTGLDALLSIVQMPKGVPVATVAIDGGENAAILASQILALSDEGLAKKLKEHKEAMRQGVQAMNQEDAIKEL